MKTDDFGLGRSNRQALKHISLYVVFAVWIQSLCCADVTKLSTEDRRVLQDFARFHEVHATTNLPAIILALYDSGGDGKLAEPGQKWNVTNAITDPTLPGQTADLGSSRGRVLRCALRAWRNRAQLSHFGRHTDEQCRETQTSFDSYGRAVQQLRSISPSIANRKSWMTAWIMRNERHHAGLKRSGGGSTSPKAMPKTPPKAQYHPRSARCQPRFFTYHAIPPCCRAQLAI